MFVELKVIRCRGLASEVNEYDVRLVGQQIKDLEIYFAELIFTAEITKFNLDLA